MSRQSIGHTHSTSYWALIAGGSRGIGLSIAKALAARHYNLLLIARDPVALAKAKKLLGNNPVEIETLSCDLSESFSSGIISAFCIDRNIVIQLFCHAAGMGGSVDFPNLTEIEMQNMIRLNLESAVRLTHSFIPHLEKTAPSHILLVSSMAAFSPLPIKNIYSSTKSALLFFSLSLRTAFQNKKIWVSCLCPGPVFTKPEIQQETIRQLGWFGKQMALSSDFVGEYAVRGLLKRKIIIVPGRLARFISLVLRIVPYQLTNFLIYKFQKKK